MWDLIVVGAGPGGSLAAKRCAEYGFKTLLLEKKRLPRDKVCSGMIAGPWATDTIAAEFGDIPKKVLARPYHLAGQMFHVPGASEKALKWLTLLGWRRDIDAWMSEKAREKGVEIRDGIKVAGVLQEKEKISVQLETNRKTQYLEARFVIGADGAASKVRSSLFPKLKIKYSTAIRECYEGTLDMDPRYLHWFFPKTRPRPRFNINFKEKFFLLEGSGITELRAEIGKTLSKYGFNPNDKPVWKDGCMLPQLHGDLIKGKFLPADRNVLLIGDAAGLLLPISFEGIGAALKSGKAAAEAIYEASLSGRDADRMYLQNIRPVVNVITDLYYLDKMLHKRKEWDASSLCEVLGNTYEKALKVTPDVAPLHKKSVMRDE